MSLDAIRALVQDDMDAVNHCITAQLHSDVGLIDQISEHIINSGGKRLRPMLTLLAAKASGYEGDKHISMATIIEFIHTATLLHDDVVDESLLRRGKATANAVYGNQASVLVGDFLYSRAFQMMVELGQMPIMGLMAETTNTIAEGEVLQLINQRDPDTDEPRYLQVIEYKTAKLFEAATRSGAILAKLNDTQQKALADYGMHLGRAYQLIDDVLDYRASSDEMGKNVGDDLAEGKPTLPLIYVMKHGTAEQAELVRNAIKTGGLEQLDNVINAIETTGALDYTEMRAQEESERAQKAVKMLPANPYRDALIDLAHFSTQRRF